MGGTLLEEDVGFVEEEDGVPTADEVENSAEAFFELASIDTKVAWTNLDFLVSSERRFEYRGHTR